MKKLLVSVFGVLTALLLAHSSAYSQSISIYGNAPVLANNSVEIPNGASIFIIRTTSLNGPHSAPVFNGSWFLPAGGDTLMPLLDMNMFDIDDAPLGWPNPLPYLAGGFQYGDDVAGIDFATGAPAGTPIYFYLRIFDKIAGMTAKGIDPSFPDKGFDLTGMYKNNPLTGNLNIAPNPADGNKLWFGAYYYDTQTFSLNVPDLGLTTPLQINLNAGTQTNNFFPMFGPVPEPSVMFLMIGGLCWLIRKVKRS